MNVAQRYYRAGILEYHTAPRYETCLKLIQTALLMNVMAFALVLYRVGPLLQSMPNDAAGVKRDIIDRFPRDLQIRLVGYGEVTRIPPTGSGTTTTTTTTTMMTKNWSGKKHNRLVVMNITNGEQAFFDVELPWTYLDLWSEPLDDFGTVSYSYPIDILQMYASVMLPTKIAEELGYFSTDRYIRSYEAYAGANVLYREEDGYWLSKKKRWGENWKTGRVDKLIGASTSLEDFSYIVNTSSNDQVIVHGGNIRPQRIRICFLPNHEYRELISSEYEFEGGGRPVNGTPIRAWSKLAKKDAVVVFGETKFLVLQGFSYYFDGFWTAVSEKDETPWMNFSMKISRGNLKKFKPLWTLVSLFCEWEAQAVLDDVCDLELPWQQRRETCKPSEWQESCTCSQEIGTKRLVTSGDFDNAIAFLRPSFLLVRFMLNELTILMGVFVEVVLIISPLAWIMSNLLRHVDTPTISFLSVLSLSSFVAKPLLVSKYLLRTLAELLSPAPWITDLAISLDVSIWTSVAISCWVSFLVIEMRKIKSNKESQRKRKARMELKILKRKCESDESLGTEGEPQCRICFGGAEDGRLISPCLCRGSIRFVHVDCLNHWRTKSSNKQSFYECDQCRFKYEFRRTWVANLLRSSLVLNLAAFLSFVVIVLFFSYLAVILDVFLFSKNYGLLGSDWLFDDEFIAQVEDRQQRGRVPERPRISYHNYMEYDLEEIILDYVEFYMVPTMHRYLPIGWFGLQLGHVFSGLGLVGFLGCILTFDRIGSPLLWTNRVHGGGGGGGARRGGNGDGGVILLVLIVLIGAIRVHISLYSSVKYYSARLLQSAEERILEVGESYDEAMLNKRQRMKERDNEEKERADDEDLIFD